MPRGRPRHTPAPTSGAVTLAPEHALVLAILERISTDVKHARPYHGEGINPSSAPRIKDQLAAVEACLAEDGGVAAWGALLGFDPDFFREQFCRKAGLHLQR